MRLARRLHVPPSFVAKMAAGERPIPIEHAAAIEQFTEGAVRRTDICPDDWRRIWPELADFEQKQAPALAPSAQAAIETVVKEAANA